jgi:hypothetical protein
MKNNLSCIDNKCENHTTRNQCKLSRIWISTNGQCILRKIPIKPIEKKDSGFDRLIFKIKHAIRRNK